MKVVEQEKWVEQRDLTVAKGPFQMDASALDGGFALPDFADLAFGCHLFLRNALKSKSLIFLSRQIAPNSI
jgi:hypothetical protein